MQSKDYYLDSFYLALGLKEHLYPKTRKSKSIVKDMIFNPPATIVFWNDGSKTVVKQQPGDEWDAEKGFFAACAKKLFGNDGQIGFEVKRWVRPYQERAAKRQELIDELDDLKTQTALTELEALRSTAVQHRDDKLQIETDKEAS
jgi:hypothetical protein